MSMYAARLRDFAWNYRRECEEMCCADDDVAILEQAADELDRLSVPGICVWKTTGNGEYRTSCKEVAYHRSMAYRYCPYCGKHINEMA